MKKVALVISLIALVFAFTVNSVSAQKVTSAEKSKTEKSCSKDAPAKACCAKSEAKTAACAAKEGEAKAGCAKSCSKAEAKSCCKKGEAKVEAVPVPKKD